MKHIKEWACEPGAEVCSEVLKDRFLGERRGCRGVRGMLQAGGVAYEFCLRGQHLFSVAPDGALGSGGSL